MPFLSSATRRALEELVSLDAGGVRSVTETPQRSADVPSDSIVPPVEAVLPLRRIRLIRQAQLALESEAAVLESVREALQRGAVWEQISEASGIGPAAAKWRWQGTDKDIVARIEAGRRRSTRPSSVPTDLPGQSVVEAARTLGVTAQAIYLRISRGTLKSTTIVLDDGRSYKRVMLP